MNKEITNPKGQHCEDKLFTLTIITVILVCLPNAFCSYSLTSRSLLKVSASVPGGHPLRCGETPAQSNTRRFSFGQHLVTFTVILGPQILPGQM